jgi:sulfide:quinone oxidoreductase
MKHIVVLGAGLGGMPMAFELQALLKGDERLTVIAKGDTFHFTPSNPWVAVNWRKRPDIEVSIAPVMAKKGINFISVGAKRVHPERNEIELNDGRTIGYDYLVIATGPDLAFDEVPGLGPDGHTQSICHVEHAEAAAAAWEDFCESPGPVVIGAAQGASCFGPA